MSQGIPTSPDPAPEPSGGERIRILLVEDDPIDQIAFQRMVRKEGLPYDYRIAGSVKTARECLSDGSYQIVVSDHNLGDGTVFDFIDRIAGTPLVVVTGTGSEATAVQAMKKGAMDYIVKDPDQFHLKLLVITIEKALSAKKLMREKEEAEVRRDQLIRELASANKELRDFAQVLSHDLKAPLRSIRMLADWLASDYSDKLDGEGRERVRLIADRADKMGALIDGVLKYSRTGCGRNEMTPVDLKALLLEVVELLAVPPGIRVDIETPFPVMMGERVCFQQIFQNLIGNAVQFMDKDPGLIKVGWIDHAQSHEFYVEDNGPGIAESQFERIFQIFQTLGAGENPREGSGLGLAIVRKLVQSHGGRVWVESRIGQGSRFRFAIPKDFATLGYVQEGLLPAPKPFAAEAP